MREAPIHDVFTDDGTIRADGRVLYDRYLMRVKTPADIEIPVGLSGGRREDPGRRRVPPAGRRRLYAGGTIATARLDEAKA